MGGSWFTSFAIGAIGAIGANGMGLALGGARPAQARPSAAQEAPAPLVVVRADLGFRIDAPGPDWTLLDEARAKKLQPRASAGAAGPNGIFAVVVVESAPADALIEVGRKLLDATELEGKVVELFEPFEHQGRPAVRWMLSGGAKDATYRHYITLVEGAGSLFRLVEWGRVDGAAPDRDQFAAFAEAFVLQGDHAAPAQAEAVADVDGVGWLVRNGVWHGRAFGMEIAPRGDWRLVVADELAATDPAASVGLVHEPARMRLFLHFERVHADEQEAWKRRARAEPEERGAPRNEAVLVSIGGIEAELRMFTPAGGDGAMLRELSGVVIDGETCVRLSAWYPTASEGEALSALQSAFAAMRFTSAKERAALASGPTSAQNDVGDGFSLRQGIYRDFRFGLTWTQPAGLFDVAIGEAADHALSGAVLTLHAPELGLRGALFARPAPSIPHAEWHATLVAQKAAGTQDASRSEPFALELGEVTALGSVIDIVDRGAPRRNVLVTAERTGWAFEIRLWGSPGILARERATVDAVLAAFSIHAAPLAAANTTGRAHYDDRLGYELASPGQDFAFSAEGEARFWPAGSLASFRNDEAGIVTVLALCGASLADGVDLFASLARNALPAPFAAAVDTRPLVHESTFEERPAVRMAWSDDASVTAWAFDRDRTLFLVLVAERAPMWTREDVEALFAFLP